MTNNLRKLTLWHTIDWYALSIGTEHEKQERKILDQAIDVALANTADVSPKVLQGIEEAARNEGRYPNDGELVTVPPEPIEERVEDLLYEVRSFIGLYAEQMPQCWTDGLHTALAAFSPKN